MKVMTPKQCEARLAAKTARIEELGALCEKAEEENGRLRAVLIDVRELGIPVEHGGDPAMIIPQAVWMRAAEAAAKEAQPPVDESLGDVSVDDLIGGNS